MFRRQFGIKSKLTGNSYERHTGDSDFQSDQAIALNGFRRDGVKSETLVSNSKYPQGAAGHSKKASLELREDIVVERTYRVHIKGNESQQELNRRGGL